MTSIGTLYLAEAAPATPRVFELFASILRTSLFIARSLSQIKAVAALAGVKFDTPANYVHYVTNKTPDFTLKFPHGKVPALETPEGLFLTESTAVIRYS